jgi:transposase-like protein
MSKLQGTCVLTRMSAFSLNMKSGNKRTIAVLEPEEDLLSGPEIARKYDLDPATIRKWRRDGAPCHLLYANVRRYKMTELQRWLQNRPKKTKTRSESQTEASK